jgi:hypothetical protein
MQRPDTDYRRELWLRVSAGVGVYLVFAVILLWASQPVGVAFFGVALIGYLAEVVWGDRRLAVLSGRQRKPPWSGSNTSSAQVLAAVPLDTAPQIALQAVTFVGERKPVLVSDWEAVGWIGSWWTNVPRFQAYQLDVFVSEGPDGLTCFTCSARPRRVMSWAGITQSRKLVARLSRIVERLTAVD